jgi:hypothetical protein
MQRTVILESADGIRFVGLRLYPLEQGYGNRLTDSGIPRLMDDPVVSGAIIRQITAATARFGLPALTFSLQEGAAVLTGR